MENLLGSRIKRLRKIRGITQEKLAEYCDVSPSCISRWETGSLYPRRNNLALLAKALQVDVQSLVPDLGIPFPQSIVYTEFAPLIEKLDDNEQEYFLKVIQSYLEMKSQRCKDS